MKNLKKRASEGYRHMSVKVDSDFFTAKQLDRLQNGLESQGFKNYCESKCLCR